MKKPKVTFSNFLRRLSSVFIKTKPPGPEFDESQYDDEDYEYIDDEDYEGYEEDKTDPSLTPLTVTDIKRKQVQDGEAPPDLPDMGLDDDEDDFYVEESGPVDATNPSIREFDLNLSSSKKMKGRLSNFASTVKSKFTKHKAPSFTMKSRSGASLEKLTAVFRNINFDEIFQTIYSAQNRPTIHRFFIIFLVVGISYFSTRTLLGFLKPVPTAAVPKAAPMLRNSSKSELRKNLLALKDNDLFGAKDEKPVIITPAKSKEPAVCDDSKTKSSLSLKLVNTVVLQDSVKSLASVQVRGKKKEQFLRVGDKVPGMIEIGRITPQKLFFKNLKSRQCEYIEAKRKNKGKTLKQTRVIRDPKVAKKIINDTKKTGIKNSGNSFKIKKDVRKKMLENISEVLTQARAVQIKNPDGSLCFKMQEIVPGSIYTQLGIQEGDKVCGINGKKITNVGELMNTFGQIDKIDHFELDVNRSGIDQNLEYDFE
jgi:type II secretion system protein C